MSKNRKIKNQKGFTLVELLITTTTVGVLASIAMGLFFTYQDRGHFAEIESVVRNFEASSFLLMQSLNEDGAVSSCAWEYDQVGGENSISCDTDDSKNLFAELFDYTNRPIVVVTQFNNVNATQAWTHVTTAFHCRINDFSNQITYFNDAQGNVVRAASKINPAAYAARCNQ